MAISNTIKGEIEEALSGLEKAIETGGEAYIEYAKQSPAFDNVRNIERFKKLIKMAWLKITHSFLRKIAIVNRMVLW
jgi:hypothetical protein